MGRALTRATTKLARTLILLTIVGAVLATLSTPLISRSADVAATAVTAATSASTPEVLPPGAPSTVGPLSIGAVDAGTAVAAIGSYTTDNDDNLRVFGDLFGREAENAIRDLMSIVAAGAEVVETIQTGMSGA